MLSSSVGERRLLQALGPGFDSQVPHLFHIFSINVPLCSAHHSVHHASQRSGLTSGFLINQKARTCSLPYTFSQPHACKRGKSNGLPVLGPRSFQQHLSNGPDTPQCLYFFSFLFSFFYSFDHFYLIYFK